MQKLHRSWRAAPPATAESIRSLRSAVGENLPNEYVELLASSNGGEAALSVQPYNLCLDSAEDALHYWNSGTYRNDFPGFFVIGGSGAGEYIAFDTRQSLPWPVVALDMTNTDLSESVLPIAKDFSGLLALVGVPRTDA